MRKAIAAVLLIAGIATNVYGWKMRGMTVSQEETRIRTETRYLKESSTHSTKKRNAAIGAGIGGVAAGIGAAVIGGVGIVACGTGFGAPAGVGLIAGATALGAGGGAVAGAATGKSETVIKRESLTVNVPYTVTVTNSMYTPVQCSAVLGTGVGMAFGGILVVRRKRKPDQCVGSSS